MKKLKIFKITLVAAILTFSSACESYLDVNENPNNLPEVGVQFLLPGAEIGTGFLLSNTIQVANSLWMQQIAGTGTQTDPYDRYNVSPQDFNNEWNGLYTNVAEDLQEVINQGQRDGNFIHAGMAQILQAYVFAMITDTWGDVPFTQALNFEQFPQPVYDRQQDIYPRLIEQIDAGIANLNKTNVIAASEGDLIYSGNIERWTRAANSLKLKLYLQSRHETPEASRTGINQLIADDMLINSNANNFNINFTASAGSQNPMYQYNHLTRANDQLISQRFYDSLRVLNDPRIPYLFTSVGGNYITYDNGVHTTTPFVAANRSRWGVYVVGNGTLNANGTISGGGAAPVRLITKSMVNFWLAEAALTLGTTGDAENYYRQAMQDHFDDIRSFNIADAGAATTFNNNATTYINNRIATFNARGSVEGKLNTIIRDKWVTTAGNAYEAYNDYRRTGYPRLALAQNAQAGVTRIPVRWPYVQTEIQANNENVPLKEYPAGLLVPVWWMPE